MLPRTQMPNPDLDQRSSPRFQVRIPLSARITDGRTVDLLSETENVSHKGLYFYTSADNSTTSDIEEGSAVEFTLTLPPEVTLTDSIPVSGQGTVVRVETGPGKIGIAVKIDAYHLDS